jgi:MscS family membrane protein
VPPLTHWLAWLAVMAFSSLIFLWVAPWWARRTPSDMDDVVVGVLQKPALGILFLLAVSNLVARTPFLAGAAGAIRQAVTFVLICIITWTIWRLVRDTMLYYGRALARRTEANFDDVLFPVLDVIAPVVIVGTGALLMLRVIGADISTLVLTTAGSAVIVGLALGDMIKNILGGLILLIDTPFRFGDLIIWEGVVCEIRRIGLRVTTLYNTEDHSEVFLPNSLLAAAKLANITRPSPDLRLPIDVTLSDSTLIPQAQALLISLADRTPYVLGDVPHKVEQMEQALAALDPETPAALELRWGCAALRHELRVDRALVEIDRLLGLLLQTIRSVEKGGLSQGEIRIIDEQLGKLEGQSERLAAAMRMWAWTRTLDPQLANYPQDRQRLLSEAESRLVAYNTRLATLREHLKQPDLYQAQRLDDLVSGLQEWLPQSFKLITPAWKHPFVAVLHSGPQGTSLQLFIYVDDVHLEHYMRRQRVTSTLREAAAAAVAGLEAKAAHAISG